MKKEYVIKENLWQPPLTKPRELYKQKGLLYRYPRTIMFFVSLTSFLVLFSKPLYDMLAPYPEIDISEPVPYKQKRRSM